jgi:small-conductance mechanosensitive channel
MLGMVWSIYKLVTLWFEWLIPVRFAHQAKKVFTYLVWGGVFLVLAVYALSGGRIAEFGIALGLFSAGISFAMQRPLLCLVGWILIHSRKLYKEGDRVQVGGITGDVADIGIMTTTVMEVGSWAGYDQSTGRLLTFPNAWILEREVRNYTSGLGHIWDEITIRIPYDANWQKAKDVLQRLANQLLKKEIDMGRRRMAKLMRQVKLRTDSDAIQLEPEVFTDLTDNWIELRLRYLCPEGKRRTVRSQLSEAMLREFKKAKIPLTVPSIRWVTKPLIPK